MFRKGTPFPERETRKQLRQPSPQEDAVHVQEQHVEQEPRNKDKPSQSTARLAVILETAHKAGQGATGGGRQTQGRGKRLSWRETALQAQSREASGRFVQSSKLIYQTDTQRWDTPHGSGSSSWGRSRAHSASRKLRGPGALQLGRGSVPSQTSQENICNLARTSPIK